MSTEIALSDYLAINNVAFEWAHSYDTKDWDRLQNILAPSTRLDFRCFKLELHENLSPTEYVAILKKALGNERLKTQHFLGKGKWERLSDDSVHVEHQIRAAHVLYVDENLMVEKNRGHGHGSMNHWFRKIDGIWKLEGVKPELVFAEHDLFGTVNGVGPDGI